MSDFLNTFLGTPEEGEEVSLPSGAGFTPGFVGPAMAAILYQVWSEAQIETYDWVEQDDAHVGFTVRRTTNGFFYYFRHRQEGMAFAYHVGAYNPRQVWRHEMPTDKVVNFYQEDAAAAWGSTVGGDSRIVGLRSKYRHEFHMLSLPSAIQALALRMGLLSEPILDLSILIDNQTFTDDFQARVIGTDNKNFSDSVLWKARADLWEALGEPDPTNYNPIGKDTSFDVSSKTLSNLLGIVTRPWTSPLWSRLVLVPDPRVDAVSNAGNRLSVPALVEIYPDEAAAREAVASERPGADSGSGPAVPKDWEGIGGEWEAELGKRKAQTDGNLPPLPIRKTMAQELSCTAEDIEAWWDLV